MLTRSHAASKTSFTVFTKPWKMPLCELGPFMRSLGVDGIELPVRPGFQVAPGNLRHRRAFQEFRRSMHEAARILANSGVRICSVASVPTPGVIEVCAELDIRIIRVLAPIPQHQTFWQAVEQMQRRWDPLLPVLRQHRVTLGVQNHCDRYLTHAMHLWYAIQRYDPQEVGAVWDPAHNALQGEDPELALDILESHLCMLSLKNATRQRRTAPHPRDGAWETYWTRGHEGLADWRRIAGELHRRGWHGNVCLHAEYTEEHRVDELIADDLTLARAVFAEAEAAPCNGRCQTDPVPQPVILTRPMAPAPSGAALRAPDAACEYASTLDSATNDG